MERVSVKEKEEICIHVIPEPEEAPLPEENDADFRFPFRQTFFRYSMHGQSEVVRSSSFVYASHHSSTSVWLDIRKLSVALVGNSEIPNLTLFAPTVKEVYFMGHIKFPSTAFRLLPQLTALEKVVFNIGFGGYINEFNESPEEFHNATPEVGTVTSLEIKMNHQIYRTGAEATRETFDRIIKSVMKHSADSFPNLSSIFVDLPNKTDFLDRTIILMQRDSLRRNFEIETTQNKIQVRPKQPIVQAPSSLPFDPCARFPTNSQYNHLRRIDTYGFNI